MSAYTEFTDRLKLHFSKNPTLLVNTLSNIFSMRLVGNKTHGDLAEIAISEFINQFMYDFTSVHVGKTRYRSKSNEEDISITNEMTGEKIPVSLKAYGNGPIQLSTDKNGLLFPSLQKFGTSIEGNEIDNVWNQPEFEDFGQINILPLIYNETDHTCNIMIFDIDRAKSAVQKICYHKQGGRRKYPIYRMYDSNNGYICEVRYGGVDANALQRGLWTHTSNALEYFDSITNGWISYSHSETLVALFSRALVASGFGHKDALNSVNKDIERLKTRRSD